MIEWMNTSKERILIVESDPTVSDLIARQTLIPLGYRVQVVGAATSALQDAIQFSPDLIIANLNLPGLSGKDLLVAFSSQGVEVPMIVLAEKGMENDVIQAFRLGAADFISYPIREAEVVSAVERILKQVRAQREKEQLSRQLNQTNQELQRRVRELTTIFAIGKAVISITDLRTLLDKIIEGAVYVTEAEMGWLLTRDEKSKAFVLSAFRNLQRGAAANLNKPWDDGLSSLVALSGETLAIHGDPLKRFKIASLGQSALVVPIKVKKEVVGLIVVVRKAPQPFGSSNQALLEAVADYASIAIVNARLFRALEERVRVSQQAVDHAKFGERIGNEMLQVSRLELSAYAAIARSLLDDLMHHLPRAPDEHLLEAVNIHTATLDFISEIATLLEIPTWKGKEAKQGRANVNELVRFAVKRYLAIAHKDNITLTSELTSLPVIVDADPSHIRYAIDGLLANAIRRSPKHDQVSVRVEVMQDQTVNISFEDHGPGIEKEHFDNLYANERPNFSNLSDQGKHYFAGLGIPLKLVRDIALANGGKIGFESKPGVGSIFNISLPVLKQ
jgi:signal transduction histidine kinase